MELSKAQMTGIITLAMILTGVIIIQNAEQTYYCEGEDNVKECISLSSTNRTCYYLNLDVKVSDLCSTGKWEKIEKYIPQIFKDTAPETTMSSLIKYRCDVKECITI